MERRKILHDLFLIGIIIKCIDGILEFIGGIALAFAKTDIIINLVQKLFQHELIQDPTDIVANYLVKTSQNLSIGILTFASIYLIIHGLIKIGLFLGLWYKKIWAYPLAGIILSLFVIYQSIRIFNTHSILLLFLTLVDIFILILLRLEYKRISNGPVA